MNKFSVVFILIFSTLMSGCGAGGYWINGNPFPDEKLKPYGAHWIKNGMTRESRREDSWECGAAATVHGADHVVFTSQQRQRVRIAEDKNDYGPDGRLLAQWRNCMQVKGYAYLAQCDERCMYP